MSVLIHHHMYVMWIYLTLVDETKANLVDSVIRQIIRHRNFLNKLLI